MTRPICSHCDRQVPEPNWSPHRPGHRVCGGCRDIICVTCPDCQEE